MPFGTSAGCVARGDAPGRQRSIGVDSVCQKLTSRRRGRAPVGPQGTTARTYCPIYGYTRKRAGALCHPSRSREPDHPATPRLSAVGRPRPVRHLGGRHRLRAARSPGSGDARAGRHRAGRTPTVETTIETAHCSPETDRPRLSDRPSRRRAALAGVGAPGLRQAVDRLDGVSTGWSPIARLMSPRSTPGILAPTRRLNGAAATMLRFQRSTAPAASRLARPTVHAAPRRAISCSL